MRIIFMGNPDFAVPSLRSIMESSHEILTVISNPPKRIGRGKKLSNTAVGEFTKTMELPLLQPLKLNEINLLRYLSTMQPDIFVVVAYKILPDKLLSIPKFGAINLHPSLLPKYRGAAPIQWSLINGDLHTAVTTISLSKRVDSGAILQQKLVNINQDDNFGTLSDRLSKIGADLIVETLDGIEKGNIAGKLQDESKVTFAPKIKSVDCQINWSKPANDIHNLIRAFSPFPGAYTTLQGKRLKIFTSNVSKSFSNKLIGSIAVFDEDKIAVQTGNGLLNIIELQIEGKKRMDIVEFLRGYKLNPTAILGE